MTQLQRRLRALELRQSEVSRIEEDRGGAGVILCQKLEAMGVRIQAARNRGEDVPTVDFEAVKERMRIWREERESRAS